MKGYKNSTKTVYESESSDYDSGYRSGKEFYSKSRVAPTMAPSEKGGVAGKITRGAMRAAVVKPVDAAVKALSHTGALTDNGAKASPAYVKGQLKARKDTVGYAKGGAVKAPPAKAYDAVKDEPTSRPLTADQMRNLRNRMKAPTPKRAYDPVKDEPTSRAFKKGGKVLRKADGGLVSPPDPYSPLSPPSPPPSRSPPPPPSYDPDPDGVYAAQQAERARLERMTRDKHGPQVAPTTSAPSREAVAPWWDRPENRKIMEEQAYADSLRENDAALDARDAALNSRVGRGMGPVMLRAKGGAVKAPAAKAVHKHERSMHPGKPLTKMQKGGKVGC